MKDHFIHCDDVESSLFTSTKVEDDNIIDLSETFNVEVQPTLDLSIEPNSTIKIS